MMSLLKKHRRFTEPETQVFLSQIIDAVEYMHKNRVLHRDLKLGNLFLNKNMEIKIGDFGLATLVAEGERKRSGFSSQQNNDCLWLSKQKKNTSDEHCYFLLLRTMCGTPNYIAPEVLTNKEGHSFEVDIWSIGVIMYTLLVGKPPFQTNDVEETYK